MGAYRKLVVVTLLLTGILLALGAYVRLSNAGLGCPDWPGCYGKLTPEHAAEQIGQAAAASPNGPVSMAKAWKEMVHRYLATTVGLLILAVGVLAWRRRRMLGQSPALALMLAPVVVLQGLFGMWTVTLLLKPAIVTGHLIGGMLVLSLLTWLTMRQVFPVRHSQPDRFALLRGLVWLALVAVAMQIVLGGWVSTNYAALACGDFPTCQGAWWPQADFRDAFHLVRELGETADGRPLTLANLVAIHLTHRLGALAVLLIVGTLIIRLWKHAELGGHAKLLAAALALQITLGIANVLLGLPLANAVAHNAGAALLLAVTLALAYRVSTGRVRGTAF